MSDVVFVVLLMGGMLFFMFGFPRLLIAAIEALDRRQKRRDQDFNWTDPVERTRPEVREVVIPHCSRHRVFTESCDMCHIERSLTNLEEYFGRKDT